ncbi:endoribonuclease [Aureococcus anophagefferens]|nr:endoribonuclease [Aureococcus anophagefferens]
MRLRPRASSFAKGKQSDEDLYNNLYLKKHGANVVMTVNTAVEGLTDLDALVPVLKGLGKRHVGYGRVAQAALVHCQAMGPPPRAAFAAGLAAGGVLVALLFARKKRRIETLFTDEACPPAGHYSQATIYDDTLYVSGLLPVMPDGRDAASASTSRTSTTGPFNAAYARFCEDHKPARAVVPVPHLHYGLALEIEATAAL